MYGDQINIAIIVTVFGIKMTYLNSSVNVNVTPFLTVKSDYNLSPRTYITLFVTAKDGYGFILLLRT